MDATMTYTEKEKTYLRAMEKYLLDLKSKNDADSIAKARETLRRTGVTDASGKPKDNIVSSVPL